MAETLDAQVPTSYWIDSTERTAYPALSEPLRVDVAIAGGGIVGLTTALLLRDAGLSVAVLEARRIVEGTTGNTTAKLTAGHGPFYAPLVRRFGEEAARAYAEANVAAIDWVVESARRLEIDCDLERTSNYVYGETEREAQQLREEADVERGLGLPATFVRETPLPFPVAGAVRLDDQAQFHPRKFLLAAAERLVDSGGLVYEQTRAHDVEGRSSLRLRTGGPDVEAGHVVLATHLPFLGRGLFFARAHPGRSYALTAPIDRADAPAGMFINVGKPTRTIRVVPDGERSLLLVGGNGHRPGEGPRTDEPYRDLERWTRSTFPVAGEITNRWSAHDYTAVDRLPYVGPLTRRSPRILVATGFGKWGLTNGVAAAHVLADSILERPNPYADLYRATRLTLRASAASFVRENANVGRHFVADRLSTADRELLDGLEPGGQGVVVRAGRRQVAVSRDGEGSLRPLSAACTHLGCIVSWNPAERTWDCPCHGSRFDPQGAVLEGPATEPLSPSELPD